ncbi:MAG TPA: glycosyltransferase family 2 protein [Candidatus Binatia bacterium]
MSAPLISILLPAYDAAGTLPACLRSIARQTEQRWECVIADDGSRDATLALAREAAARDPRFRVLSFPHRGLVATLNDALPHCRGKFVARMDADDVMHRERLAAQLAALERAPRLAAVGCHVRVFPRSALGPGLRAYERWLNSLTSAAQVRADALVESPVAHPTLFVRSEVLRAFGYRDLGWPEDYDLVLRLLAAGHEVGVVPRRLVCWREHGRRLTHTADAYRIERFTLLKASFLASSFLADVDTYVLWGYGHTGRALRRALLAHGKRPSHVVELHPGRLGQTIHGAPVVPPDALPALAPRRIVASVAGAEARGQIREALRGWGFRELVDFVCAA